MRVASLYGSPRFCGPADALSDVDTDEIVDALLADVLLDIELPLRLDVVPVFRVAIVVVLVMDVVLTDVLVVFRLEVLLDFEIELVLVLLVGIGFVVEVLGFDGVLVTLRLEVLFKAELEEEEIILDNDVECDEEVELEDDFSFVVGILRSFGTLTRRDAAISKNNDKKRAKEA